MQNTISTASWCFWGSVINSRYSTVYHIIYISCVCMFSSVPVAWRTDFVAESKEAEAKINSLKTWIRNNDFKVTEKWVQYICFVSTVSIYVFIFALLHILSVIPVNGVGWWMESPIWKAWRTLGRRCWRISGKPYSSSLWRSDYDQNMKRTVFVLFFRSFVFMGATQ